MRGRRSAGRALGVSEYMQLLRWSFRDEPPSTRPLYFSGRHLRRARVGVGLVLLGECALRACEARRVCFSSFIGCAAVGGVWVVNPEVAKGRRARMCYASAFVLSVLRWWAAVTDELYGAFEWQNWPVVWSGLSTGYGARGFQAIFQRAGRQVLGRDVWPHDLRRMAAERMRGAADVRAAQQLLGHASLETTQRYLDASLSKVAAACELLGAQAAACCGVAEVTAVAQSAQSVT